MILSPVRSSIGEQTKESSKTYIKEYKMVTKDRIIGELINEHPELVRTFFANGMMCIGCPASQGESIEQASMVHGIDTDQLVNALNEALEA